jgi:protein-tyrosine-phosphatase
MNAHDGIVFVCTGNMCRSPFAEFTLRKLAGDAVAVSSVGLAAWNGKQAAPAAVRAARQFGIDLSMHRSRALDENLLRQAGGIYVFERMPATTSTPYSRTWLPK